MRSYYAPVRYLCEVLEDMRRIHKTRNYSVLPSLVEEVQLIANRMEAGLELQADIKGLLDDRTKLKKEVKELEATVEELKNANNNTKGDTADS